MSVKNLLWFCLSGMLMFVIHTVILYARVRWSPYAARHQHMMSGQRCRLRRVIMFTRWSRRHHADSDLSLLFNDNCKPVTLHQCK